MQRITFSLVLLLTALPVFAENAPSKFVDTGGNLRLAPTAPVTAAPNPIKPVKMPSEEPKSQPPVYDTAQPAKMLLNNGAETSAAGGSPEQSATPPVQEATSPVPAPGDVTPPSPSSAPIDQKSGSSY